MLESLPGGNHDRATRRMLAALLLLMFLLLLRKGAQVNFERAKTTNDRHVFITVKTTEVFHNTRVRCILETWFQLAPDIIYFITDAADPVLSNKTNGHLINTPCKGGSHGIKPLYCKLTAELYAFGETNYRWFCHFDDDNYVNVPSLSKLLETMDPRRDHYLGKRSRDDRVTHYGVPYFWFATGGAGFCLSRALFNKIMPYLIVGRPCQGMPDDVAMGYLVRMVHAKLTEVEQFHSHLEYSAPEWRRETAREQITFGHQFGSKERTCPFRRLHCYLFPDDGLCNLTKGKRPR
uniref:Fringe glycosyltransferase n=1 Tax=Trichuris muris TaxID=70415 RepID=A0A5S6QVV2_TRIMR